MPADTRIYFLSFFLLSLQEVQPDIVKLLVIENIMLQPSMDVYILPLSFIDYQVERRKHGRSEVITMPSEQYSLELTNTTVGELNSQRSRVTGLVVGYTEIVLQDISILDISLERVKNLCVYVFWSSRE